VYKEEGQKYEPGRTSYAPFFLLHGFL